MEMTLKQQQAQAATSFGTERASIARSQQATYSEMIAKAKELYASGVGRSQPFRFFSNDCGRSQHENRSRLVRKADVAVSHGDCQLCGQTGLVQQRLLPTQHSLACAAACIL